MPHEHPDFTPHDHAACAQEAMAQAEDRMAQTGQRLTPVRRRALEILLESPRALGAYEVLERLVAVGFAISWKARSMAFQSVCGLCVTLVPCGMPSSGTS